MQRILITGINGFTGSHMADALVDKAEVYGIIRGRCKQLDFIQHIKNKLNLIEGDFTDINSMEQVVREVEPDVIFHLGAQSFVPTSWRMPHETFNSNLFGTLNILEVLRKAKKETTILIPGSSEEYGLVHDDELPIKETNELRPLSPYAVSKVAQDLLGWQYHRSYGLKVIRTRSFNIIGPRSAGKIIAADFSKQISDIEQGKKEPVMSVGDLTSTRDFNDVRDVVRAYLIAVEKCKPGEVYNVCTGKETSMQTLLDKLLSLTKSKITVKKDPAKMRPSDVPRLFGDSTKFRKQTGWAPQKTFDQSVEDTLNYWRQQSKD